MTLIDEATISATGNDQIDGDHVEFIQLVNQLDKADNPEFAQLFRLLHEHVVAHFERENQLMAQCGFPAESEHKSEHQRVLSEFKQFQSRVDKGLVGFGRAFVRERLPGWFAVHVATMDSKLASYIRQYQA
ncbi:hemerythrin family protein [Methylomonas sp. EFPC3]|uniref:bacteriohemerythrin n=1 Tax=Methylomonas sp. EFPC3 TaxID=3021710 RepID=UPI002415BFAF|nr:hemerythrin family protein [Methylomonas sp. EFPC3]WFP51058.1 hemerythrin family protein [Methylomonas sp. EFPC3]